MMQICPKCAAEFIKKKKFCTNCGEKLSDLTGKNPNEQDEIVSTVPFTENKSENKQSCMTCGADLKPGKKFCINCGTRVEEPLTEPEIAEQKCKQCGEPFKPGKKFCTICGARVEESSVESAVVVRKCRQCGEVLKEGKDFCVKCGMLIDKPTEKGFDNLNPAPKRRNKWLLPVLGFSGAGVLVAGLVIAAVLLLNNNHNRPSSSGLSSNPTLVPYSQGNDPQTQLSEITVESAEMSISGTEAFTILPIEGVTLSAQANAIDQERDFVVRTLSEAEIANSIQQMPGSGLIPIAGIDINSGMQPGEQYPGVLEVELDLEKMGVPEAFWDSIVMYRVDENGNFATSLPTKVQGNLVYTSTESNTGIECAVALVLLGTPTFVTLEQMEKRGWLDSQNASMNWDMAGKGMQSTKAVEGYTVYWPGRMQPANPAEVQRQADKLQALYDQYGIDVDGIVEARVSPNANSLGEYLDRKERLAKLFADPEYKQIKALVESEGWQRENLWPYGVRMVVEQLKIADSYLFGDYTYGRGFRKYSNVDIIVFDKWPNRSEANTVLGISRNPWTQIPYVQVNLEYGGAVHTAANYENNRSWYDDLLITLTHEIFHVSQIRYLNLISQDTEKDVWFWEATAIALEKEAIHYYNGSGKFLDNSQNYAARTDGFRVKQALLSSDPLAYSQGNYGAPANLQNQAYFYSMLVEQLRDSFSDDLKISRDDFMIYLLTEYGQTRDAIQTFEKLLGVTSEEFELIFENFIVNKKQIMGEQWSVSNVTPRERLPENAPIVTINAQTNPMSTMVTVFSMEREATLDDVKVVLRADQGALSPSQRLSLWALSGVNGRYGIMNLPEPGGLTQPYYDIRIPDENLNTAGSNRNVELYLQQIHFDHSELPQTALTVFAMYRPARPEAAFIDITDEMQKLGISIQESNLKAAGIVEEYLVSVKTPSGEIYRIRTDQNHLELLISADQMRFSDSIHAEDGVLSVEIEPSSPGEQSEPVFKVLVQEITNSDQKVLGPSSPVAAIASEIQVSLSADASQLYLGEDIHFDVVPKNDAYSYTWFPGNNSQMDAGDTLTYKYDYPGEYTCSVTVFDQNGSVLGSDIWEIEVIEEEVQTATATALPTTATSCSGEYSWTLEEITKEDELFTDALGYSEYSESSNSVFIYYLYNDESGGSESYRITWDPIFQNDYCSGNSLEINVQYNVVELNEYEDRNYFSPPEVVFYLGKDSGGTYIQGVDDNGGSVTYLYLDIDNNESSTTATYFAEIPEPDRNDDHLYISVTVANSRTFSMIYKAVGN